CSITCSRTGVRSPAPPRPMTPLRSAPRDSAMELIAVSPAGRHIIERYAASGLRVSGVVYQGPVLVFPDRTLLWPAAALTSESLALVAEHGEVELLLLGLGRRMVPVAADLRAWLK